MTNIPELCRDLEFMGQPTARLPTAAFTSRIGAASAAAESSQMEINAPEVMRPDIADMMTVLIASSPKVFHQNKRL